MIPPISAIKPLSSFISAGSTTGIGGVGGATGGAAGVTSGGFANALTNAINQVQQVQTTASSQAAQAAAGQGNIADAMLASTQASVEMQVASAVTNKAVAAFTQIMNMQV